MHAASGGSGRALAEPAPARPLPSGPWADLALRTVSAVVLLPPVFACIWYGGAAWSTLLIVGGVVLVMEWQGMCRAGHVHLPLTLAGLAYIMLAFASLIWLRRAPGAGRMDVLFLLLVIWACDIGGYLAGRAVGGPRLAPRISPGKTWSGALGGVLAAVLAGLALALAGARGGWEAAQTPAAAAVLAAILAIAAQLGDLLESALKRHCGVKDSGRLIPGHGGLLDRVDGILLAAPVLAGLTLVAGRGLAP